MNSEKPIHFEARLDGFLNLIGKSLDEDANGDSLAHQANYSRFYFQRLFRASAGETPGDLRRRLLLERAAHQLRRTKRPITELAFDAGYDSLEGFSRAFRKAYGVSPSHYRRLEPLSWYLAAPNDVHYDPRAQGPVRLMQIKGEDEMDLTDRLIGNDAWLTRQLLDKAATLTDAQLDAPLATPEHPLPFEGPEKTLRELLNRIVFTKETWIAAIHARPMSENPDTTVAGLKQRMAASYGEFAAVVRMVRAEHKWDETFTDALCEPPETFSYGGMIAHVITFSSFRCIAAIRAMQTMGMTDLGYGDPIEWERQLSASA